MGTKITNLEVTNFKRISIVNINPETGAVLIAGRNAQGKSSVLDAIDALLRGGKAFPDVPVRKGEAKATLRCVLDDGITIERGITEAGTKTLKITNADGMSPTNPQAWLDSKLSAATCDPLAFVGMKPRDQADELRRLIGVDTSALDAERGEVYAARTADGRQLKSVEGSLALMVAPADDCPTEVVSAGLLAGKLEEAQDLQRKAYALNRDADDCAEHAGTLEHDADSTLSDADEEGERLQVEADQLRDEANRLEARIVEVRKEAAAKAARLKRESVEKMDEAKALRDEAEAITVPDIEAIRSQLAEVDTINEQVRAAEKYRERAAEVTDWQAKVEAHTARIAEIDAERAALLAKADWPIDGLGIDDGCVTFAGVPLAQASQAEQLRVGVGLALAGNPEIKVALVRDGSHLDAESLALLAAAAEEAGAQVWVERVGTHDAGAVVIEDGAVAGEVPQC